MYLSDWFPYVSKWSGMGTLSASFFDCSPREELAAGWLRDALQLSCGYQPVRRGCWVVVVVGSNLPHKAPRKRRPGRSSVFPP